MAKFEHAFEIFIEGSLQEVWDEITKRGAVQRPLMDTVLVSELVPGSPFNYLSPDGKYTFVHGTLLEIDPPRRLVHTYKFTLPKDDPPSRVTWELEQMGTQVRVTLIHDQFAGETKTYRNVKAGWEGILASLKVWIETGDIAIGTKVKYAVYRLMMPLLPRDYRTK